MMSGVSNEATSGDGEPTRGAEAPGDDAREVIERLRSAPAAEIMTDLFSTLLSTAQVKLGRRDARLFIDLCSEALEYTGPHLPEELRRQVDRALGQLRLAQVNAENQVADNGEPEPNDLTRIPTPPPGGGQRKSADPASEGAPQSSKLWIPGG